MKHPSFYCVFSNKKKQDEHKQKTFTCSKTMICKKIFERWVYTCLQQNKCHNNSTKTTFACCLPFIIITLLQFKRQCIEFGWFTWIWVDSKLFTSNRLTIFQCIRINGSNEHSLCISKLMRITHGMRLLNYLLENGIYNCESHKVSIGTMRAYWKLRTIFSSDISLQMTMSMQFVHTFQIWWKVVLQTYLLVLKIEISIKKKFRGQFRQSFDWLCSNPFDFKF